MNEDWIGETVLPIDDPQVPSPIRIHGSRFRNPATFVIDAGSGAWLLYGEDGEFLDCAWIEGQRCAEDGQGAPVHPISAGISWALWVLALIAVVLATLG